MISISKGAGNATNGSILLRDTGDSTLDSLSVRLTRNATLDGSSYVDRIGYSDTDREMQVVVYATKDEAEVVKDMLENENIVGLSTPAGFFSTSVSRMSHSGGKLTIVFFIREKLSA
jgi:hypothetical protein